MQPRRSLGALGRPLNDTARAKKLRRAMSRRDSLVAVSKMLILESKLLLLNRAQRMFLTTQTERDLKAVDNRLGEVRQADAALRAREIKPLGIRAAVYAGLVKRAVHTRARLAAICAELPPEERFQTAADIQMLEELIAEWTAAARKIKRASRPAASSS